MIEQKQGQDDATSLALEMEEGHHELRNVGSF